MNSKILVFGGTGFVGEGIVTVLIRNGYRPILFVRDTSKISFEIRKKVDIIQGNLSDIKKYKNEILTLNPDTIIYSVGLIKESKRNKFLNFHYKWPLEILRILDELNPKFIYISANGSDKNAVPYQKTKLMFENKLKLISKNFVILKPSLIWGNSDKYNFQYELDRLTKYRTAPIIGRGSFLLSPVLRTDLSKIVLWAIESDIRNKIYSLCGPKKYHFVDLVQNYADSKNRSIFKIHLPVFVFDFLSKYFSKFGFPLSNDQLKMLQQGNYCKDNSVWTDSKLIPSKIF